MIRKVCRPLVLAVLALGLTVGQGFAQTAALPPAPVPVAPSSPAGPPSATAGPTSPTLGAPAPAWSQPQPLPPAPAPTGPFGSGPPPGAPFEDRNGPLLKGDPFLDRPGELLPGWFAEVDVSLLVPHVKNNLVAPVTLGGLGTDQVHVPQAELDTVGSPRLGVGYRLPEGCGEFLASYRFLISEGSATLIHFDPLGDGELRNRLNLNVWDFDYASREYSLGPWWEMKWDAGIRLASIFFDARAQGLFLEQRTSNNFIGAGPHFGLEVARRLDVPGLSAFAKVDGGFLLGQISQSFEETFAIGNLTGGGAANQHATQAVPVLTFELGLSWLPCNDHMRFRVGYQFEQWWYLGQVGDARAELTDQGIFFRSEFNF